MFPIGTQENKEVKSRMSDYIANTKDLLKSVSHFREHGKGENKGPLQERASLAYLPIKKE